MSIIFNQNANLNILIKHANGSGHSEGDERVKHKTQPTINKTKHSQYKFPLLTILSPSHML
jgi:hypothetical protein